MVRRTLAAALLLAMLGGQTLPASAAREIVPLELLNTQSCAARSDLFAQITPTPSPSPSGSPGVPLPQPATAPGKLYATPFPTSSPVTPPPIPTPTPRPSTSPQPNVLVRPSATPSIEPAGSPTPAASPTPITAPTLAPGYGALIADKLVGGTKPGQPGDAIGNVHIFYQDEILVGDRAHYDGIKTITISGNPYIVNTKNTSIYHSDQIIFDTISQRAELVNGHGESSEGVERGLVYFSAKDLTSDEHGVAHGEYANVTTCARPRAGYHLTGRTLDVFPGDKLVITKAVLWLGAAAIFYLPRIVIPLRRVDDERQRPSFFPEIGYNQYQGWYVKSKIGFGKDQYYYGYYRLEYYSREGFGLGYNGALNQRNGKRQASLDYYQIHDRRIPETTMNLNAQDTENFSQRLRANLGFTYNSNFGPLVSLPPNESFSAAVAHNTTAAFQTYTFARSSVNGQSSTNNLGFTDTRSFGLLANNSLTVNWNKSNTTYGGFNSANTTANLSDLLHWHNALADYQLLFDKSFSQTPFGLNKEPELQIRPNSFLRKFFIPMSSQFTIGRYNEPSTPLTTTRADLNFTFGPALYHFLNSDFSSTVNVHQFAYGTGDLKASIDQQMTLSTSLGDHIVNSVTYHATSYNGPASVPFTTIDLQPGTNYKNAADVLRLFNGDYYNLTLNFGTSFNRLAQPISYQLATRPSYRSWVALGGAFIPGPGNGFYTTNLQFSTPFGNGSTLQFIGDIDWKNKGRIINKTIYYSRIIGDCYEIQVQYNQAARQVNVTLNLLAFPSRAANFGLNTSGSIVPTSLNLSTFTP